ncbi:MAG: EamA family transporter, partial [Opitutaceae bacterium]|nr:EamA family transporter [Opitutaceae bacterium]
SLSMLPIVFALCCLFFSALNDFVFKLYARRGRSRGTYIAIIGVVWVAVFCLFFDFSYENWQVTVLWGLIAGLLSVVANILLVESMTSQEAGVCSTIYRLNLVVVVLGAFVLLGESLTYWKIGGVLLAVTAVFLFLGTDGGKSHAMLRKGTYLAVIAAFLRAGMGLSYKYAFIEGADRSGLLALTGSVWIVGGLSYAFFREGGIGFSHRKSWGYGLLSGLLICGIVYFMALALQYGEAGIVLPIAQMSFLGTFVLGVFFLKESLSRRKLLGIAVGILCVFVMSAGQWLG